MKAVIFFTLSKKSNAKGIASNIEGDLFQIVPKGKVVRGYFFQMLVYGFKTMRNSNVEFIDPKIDFDLYEELDFVFPIWAGRPALFMTKFLEVNQFRNKKIRMIGTSDSGSFEYTKRFEDNIDASNNIIEKIMYKKDILQS